jgi:hypothetical protein
MPQYTVKKRIAGYAYPRNGSMHNPTPRIVWELFDGQGKLVDSSPLLRKLTEFYGKENISKAP